MRQVEAIRPTIEKELSAMNIHQKLRLGLVGALILLTGLGFVSQRRLEVAVARTALVSHTHEVLEALNSASAAVHWAESEERGYLLTPTQDLEAAFHAAQGQARSGLERVRSLTAADADRQPRLARLQQLTEQALASEERYIAAARTNQHQTALAYTLAASGNEQRMQEIDSAFSAIEQQEEALRLRSLRSSHEASALAGYLVSAGSIIGIAFVSLCALWISRDLRRCEEAEISLRQVREGLEARVQARTADLSKTTASLEAEIGERRHTEEQLRDSEQRYRLLFEDSPLPMEVFDPETLAYLAVNTAAAELYGYSPEEFLHMTLLDLRPAGEIASFSQYFNTVKTADAYCNTFVTRHKSGRLITIEAKVRCVEFGGRSARLKLVTDVTEKKRLETQLLQAQKMEAVGRLAGGVAHDFNNLLMVILGYSDSVLYKLDDSDPNRAKVSEIHAAAQRAANLTSQLLAFSRQQILQMQPVQLNGVVSNISQMLRRLLGEDIDISLKLQPDLCLTLADPAQLEQVLVNLAVNARDAMPHGGKLLIETCDSELDEQSASARGVPAGKYVLLIVNDTGFGMDEATKSKIFEPFFTTKEVGKGTGLGLSMVLGVVQQSGGAVAVSSEVGLGTTFRIYLPRLDAPAPALAEPLICASFAPLAEAGGTILLVEDEKQLRTLAREVLKEAGYTVLEAGNGKEALELADTLSGPPALLLTDVVMPEMSGPQLVGELKKKWPRLIVIYTSGYTDHALLGRNNFGQDVPFLQKPYLPGQLLDRVAQVLDSERSPVVLIVDDDQDTRFQLRTSVEAAGCQTVEAANGQEALAILSAHAIKLVITDLFMPERDGLELISELKRTFPEVKILALSGAQSGTFLKLASSLGADAVVSKPFLSERITEIAEALLA